MTTTRAISAAPLERPDWSQLPEALPLLRQHLRRTCRDPNDLEDALQETLIRAARYKGRGEGPRRLHAWLRCIASNVIRDQARRRRLATHHQEAREAGDAGEHESPPMPEPEEPPLVPIATLRLEQDRALLHLGNAFDDLAPMDRDVLRRYYAGASCTARVAEALDLPRPLVKVRLFRARQRLRSRVERAVIAERAGLSRPGRPDRAATFLQPEQ